jgi:import inner membrane translocase subunit TIM22
MNFPGMGGGGGVPGIPSGGSATGSVPPGFDPNDPNVKWVCSALSRLRGTHCTRKVADQVPG